MLASVIPFVLACAARAGLALSGSLALIEEGGSIAVNNLADGKTAFAKDVLAGYTSHTIPHLNDQVYGNFFSWIGNSDNSFAGINLGATPITVNGFAFGRDNTGSDTDRAYGLYTLQYTTVPNPDAATPDSSWTTIGTLNYGAAGGTNFSFPYKRHRYTFAPVAATGIRLRVPGIGLATGACIDELEIYCSIVTTVADELDVPAGSNLSLREAIRDLPAGSMIAFAHGLAGQTLTLAGELLVEKPLTIDGSGLGAGLTISGGNNTRLFHVTASGNLTLRGLILTGGNGNGAGFDGYGGAIYNSGGCTIERCTLFSNHSNLVGGGVFNDDGGTLDVRNSTLTANVAVHAGGGAIMNWGAVSMACTTVVANSSGAFGGGIHSSEGDFVSLSLSNCIVASNTAPADADIFGYRTGEHNFISDDPDLLPLGNYGGPTPTMPPLPDSPVIDGGGLTQLTTDQRGVTRVLGSGLDIGACENAVSSSTPDGLTIHAVASVADQVGVFEITPRPWVDTFAGAGLGGFVDGSAASAEFAYPAGVAVAADGKVFIADAGNNRIRMLGTGGEVTTIAGSGSFGWQDGPGPEAAFAFPTAVAVDAAGKVYVADTYNHRICTLTPPAAAGGTWVVATLAGSGWAGFRDGIGTTASFNQPSALAVDSNGDVYVADTSNHRIRRVSSSGMVSTYAGSGSKGLADGSSASAALFDTPGGVALVGETLYVTDTGNHRIRKITEAGAVSTFAGSTEGYADGTGTAAKFKTPSSLAALSDGTLYVADQGNHRIRKVTSAGVVSTLAGAGVADLVNGDSAVACFHSPTGVAVTSAGNLVVADFGNHVLRQLVVYPVSLSVPSQPVPGGATGPWVQVSADLDSAALGLEPRLVYGFRWKSATSGLTHAVGQGFVVEDGSSEAGFRAWQIAKFAGDADNPLIAGASACPAGDGVCNLIKYALGVEPYANAMNAMPVSGLGAGLLTLTYGKILAATDVLYTVEWSSNLGQWSPDGVTEQVLSGNDVSQRIQASVPITPGTRKFLRLKVSLR
jgi:hypothetical protein